MKTTMRDLIERCWKGYEPVPGKEPYSNDSCRKKQGKKAKNKKNEDTKDKKWIQKAVDPDHEGYCTPMTKDTCTPRRKALAKTFKKMGRKRDRETKAKNENTFYTRAVSMLQEGTPAWQRKAGKNPKGGLNKKGVASYRAANPGSKLKTAVTTKPSKLKKGSKSAKRRKSFCARMSGMRKRQKASNNTGKDRLSLSLKKWNC